MKRQWEIPEGFIIGSGGEFSGHRPSVICWRTRPYTRNLSYYDDSNPFTRGNPTLGGAAAAVCLRGSVDGKFERGQP